MTKSSINRLLKRTKSLTVSFCQSTTSSCFLWTLQGTTRKARRSNFRAFASYRSFPSSFL